MGLQAHATSLRLNLGMIPLAFIAASAIFVARDVEAQSTTVTKKPDLVITGATVQSYVIVTQYQNKIYSTPIFSTSYVEIEATIANKGTEAAVFYPNVRVFDVQTGPAPTKNAKADDLAAMTILPPGVTVKKRLTIARPSELAPGNYSIKLTADPTSKIAETDEANNGYDASFSVAAEEEWVTCPSVGVPTYVDTALAGGKLRCMYLNANNLNETLTTRVVASTSGLPFTSCLRANDQFGKPGARGRGMYSERVYCSLKKSQPSLVAGAVGWSTSTDRRIGVGWHTKNGNEEPEYWCRANLAVLPPPNPTVVRIGRVWRDKCYVPNLSGQEVRIDSGFEQLVLTKPYGVPSSHYMSGSSSSTFIWAKNYVMWEPNLKFCLLRLRPGSDFAQMLGLAPDLELEQPGTEQPGNVCTVVAQGKQVTGKPGDGSALLLK